MSKSLEEQELKKLISKFAGKKELLARLLADPGLWATVFAHGFRPPDGDPEGADAAFQDTSRELFLGSKPPPSELSEQPVFSFHFPKNWAWHVWFHGGDGGGYSHVVAREGIYEGVARIEAHSERWNEVSVAQLKEMTSLAAKTGTVPTKYLVPLLFTATIPSREDQRQKLETWAAAQMQESGILKETTPKEFAEALWLTSPTPHAPKATAKFRQFLGDLGIG